jgi:CheY-like chemotaxis protein
MYKINSEVLKDKKILVADDDRASFLYIEAILEKSGAKLFWVENGLQAVEFVKKKPDLDVILMDLKMSIMNGQEAIAYINDFCNTLPIVVQSCNVKEYIIENPEMKENMGFLEKPFKPSDLIEAISNVLKITTWIITFTIVFTLYSFIFHFYSICYCKN